MAQTATYEPGFLDRLSALDGRVALVLGGHGDLAHAIGAALADKGADIVLAARKLVACEALAQEIAARFGRRTFALGCDVAKEDQIVTAVRSTLERFGRLDILVNNAGTSWSGAPEAIPLTGWSKVIDVNLTGAFVAAREAAKPMLAAGKGAIVFVASSGAFTSFAPDVAQIIPYTTSKAALVHLARDLAAQWAERGVRVNAIAPGQMQSGMTLTLPSERIATMRGAVPMRRLGDPQEIAGAVAYLVSDAASYVTGHTLVIDGGLTLG